VAVRQFVSSSVRQFVSSSVRRFVGSAVRRFGGSSVRRFVGSTVTFSFLLYPSLSSEALAKEDFLFTLSFFVL
jgi:hypothetical protein